MTGTITPVIDASTESDAEVEQEASGGEVTTEPTFTQPQESTIMPESIVSQDLMQFFTQVSPDAAQMPNETDEPDMGAQELSADTIDAASEEGAIESPEPITDNAPVTENLEATHILMRQIDLRDVKGEALGECFYQWLDAVLCGGVHPVNRQGALFHRLEQGFFVVSPGAFKQFVQERCQYGKPTSYSEVQQALQPLGKHITSAQERNVHKALIKGSDSTLNGFLFATTPQWETHYAINPHVYLEDV